ncbi:hypothetical protein MMC11_003350 [Xylographa trunciseda]|nr:hypothetical protein [Xylographa trunciseda]
MALTDLPHAFVTQNNLPYNHHTTDIRGLREEQTKMLNTLFNKIDKKLTKLQRGIGEIEDGESTILELIEGMEIKCKED